MIYSVPSSMASLVEDPLAYSYSGFRHMDRNIYNGGELDVIYLDFMKAFDSVPHKRLINKLNSYGIQGNILNWIKAFLTNRKQRVSVKGCYSKWSNVI